MPILTTLLHILTQKTIIKILTNIRLPLTGTMLESTIFQALLIM